MYLKGFCKNMGQEDKSGGICHLELRRKARRFGTSKNRKAIHMETEKQILSKKVCWAIFNNGPQRGL